MNKPKILIILGAAIVLSGCNSMPSMNDSMAEVKESFTGSMAEVQDALGDSMGDVQNTFGRASFPFSSTPETLTEDEVRDLFVGHTVDSQNRRTGLNSITYYHPNGRAIQKRLWSQRSGTWSIQDNGQICLAFGKSSKQCRHIIKEGDRIYKIRANSDGEMQKVVRYRVFVEGNRLKSES